MVTKDKLGTMWGICLGALLTIAVAPLHAAHPTEDWNEPFVVRLEVYTGELGRRLAALPGEDWLVLDEGAQVEIDVVGIDQRDRPFPAEHFVFDLELDWRCRGLLELTETHEGAQVLVAGSRSGDCQALLSVPGNMNLDRQLLVRVGAALRAGFSRAQAEWTASRLYEAILGRNSDDRGLAGATVEIQRGNLDSQVSSMFASNEFRLKRAGLPPAERLEDLYRGILGRDPDSGGVRAYLDDMARGRQAEVTLTLLRSQEFELRLLREVGP